MGELWSSQDIYYNYLSSLAPERPLVMVLSYDIPRACQSHYEPHLAAFPRLQKAWHRVMLWTGEHLKHYCMHRGVAESHTQPDMCMCSCEAPHGPSAEN